MSTLYQYSHFLALSRQLYDGDLSIQALRQQGNIGLGTFNALDGELIVINDTFYQSIGGDKINIVDNNTLIPWAAVTRFTDACHTQQLEQIESLKTLEQTLLALMQSKNYPYVFQVTGEFENITFIRVC